MQIRRGMQMQLLEDRQSSVVAVDSSVEGQRAVYHFHNHKNNSMLFLVCRFPRACFVL